MSDGGLNDGHPLCDTAFPNQRHGKKGNKNNLKTREGLDLY